MGGLVYASTIVCLYRFQCPSGRSSCGGLAQPQLSQAASLLVLPRVSRVDEATTASYCRLLQLQHNHLQVVSAGSVENGPMGGGMLHQQLGVPQMPWYLCLQSLQEQGCS